MPHGPARHGSDQRSRRPSLAKKRIGIMQPELPGVPSSVSVLMEVGLERHPLDGPPPASCSQPARFYSRLVLHFAKQVTTVPARHRTR